ncbi:hypothetical protein AAZV13_16G074900 [Glycine max]
MFICLSISIFLRLIAFSGFLQNLSIGPFLVPHFVFALAAALQESANSSSSLPSHPIGSPNSKSLIFAILPLPEVL